VPVAICCGGNLSKFNIIGSHSYTRAGTYSVTATVTNPRRSAAV
jgi:PKD repeat protein